MFVLSCIMKFEIILLSTMAHFDVQCIDIMYLILNLVGLLMQLSTQI